MKLLHTLVAAALSLSAASASAALVPYAGSFTVGNTGEVVATFLGHTAAYSNDLYFSTDSVNWTWVFNNHSTAPGTTQSLGSFTAGTELFFSIFVNNTGDTFYSGAGSNNADGLVHVATEVMGDVTHVGFEDLYGGGDLDYDDVRYSFQNITAVPEPETWAMMLAGLGMAGLASRRRRRS